MRRIKDRETKRINERRRPRLITVEYEGSEDTYTIFGDFIEGEVTSIEDDIGQERIDNLSQQDEPGLFRLVHSINALLGPRVISVEVD